MTTAMTIAAGFIGFVLLLVAFFNLRERETGYAAFSAGIGAPLFAAAVFDLAVTFA